MRSALDKFPGMVRCETEAHSCYIGSYRDRTMILPYRDTTMLDSAFVREYYCDIILTMENQMEKADGHWGQLTRTNWFCGPVWETVGKECLGLVAYKIDVGKSLAELCKDPQKFFRFPQQRTNPLLLTDPSTPVITNIAPEYTMVFRWGHLVLGRGVVCYWGEDQTPAL